jgi:hypothetical protein
MDLLLFFTDFDFVLNLAGNRNNGKLATIIAVANTTKPIHQAPTHRGSLVEIPG